jgi:uncharacterized protein YodC (DUF2158 family)
MAFQEGDVVQLKSGGPRMTVEGYEDGLVVCVWFEEKNRKNSAFKEATIQAWIRPVPVYVGRR